MKEKDKLKTIIEKTLQSKKNRAESSARARIDNIFDKESFFELNSYVARRPTELDMDFSDGEEGVICGIGTIEGRQVYCFSQDAGQMSGSIGKTHADKICETVERAVKSGIPLICIYDTKGAKIAEGVEAVDGYARIMSSLERALGTVPVISYVAGECAASAAAAASMSDFIIIEEGASLGVVPDYILKSTFGDKGAFINSAAGSYENGKASFYAESPLSAAFTIRKLLGYLPDNCSCVSDIEPNDDMNRLCPELNDMAENDEPLLSIKSIVQSIADQNSEFEISAGFGQNAYAGFIRINGITSAVAGLSDMADYSSLIKLSKFTDFAGSYSIPLVFISDCEGYSAPEGSDAGLLAAAAKLAQSISSVRSPKITLLAGRAYGAGYILSMPKGLGSDFVFAWPTAKIGALKPDTAVNMLYADELRSSENPADERDKLKQLYETQLSSPIAAARSGLIDDIIIPSDTRKVLIYTLSSLMRK